MDPAEISNLNLAQVTEKLGRDYRLHVYLKKRLVRRKAVAEALVKYRKRDREGYPIWDLRNRCSATPINRLAGGVRRVGTGEIEAVLERYARRAIKTLLPAPAAPEPAPLPPPPPIFWIADVEYRRH